MAGHWGEGSKDLHTFIQDCAEARVAYLTRTTGRQESERMLGMVVGHGCWAISPVDLAFIIFDDFAIPTKGEVGWSATPKFYHFFPQNSVCWGVLSFVEDPDLSASTACATSATLLSEFRGFFCFFCF